MLYAAIFEGENRDYLRQELEKIKHLIGERTGENWVSTILPAARDICFSNNVDCGGKLPAYSVLNSWQYIIRFQEVGLGYASSAIHAEHLLVSLVFLCSR